jgi:hypothetical protein
MVKKPSEKEEEYFLRMEAERIRRLREEHERKVAAAERQRLKELHYLHCPKCGMKMTTSSLDGIEVDVCPDCKGIYLDAGELDKILGQKARTSPLATLRDLLRL